MRLHMRSNKAKSIICLVILVSLFVGLLSGCGKKDIPDPKNPVTLTLWHTYGQQLSESMEKLIEEFNNTAGAEKAIIIQTAYVADASEMNARLMMSANKEFGAPPLPDLAVIYPRIGVTLADMGLLMDLSSQFNPDELSAFVTEFLEEGKLGGTLHILPIAKSTEVLLVNSTIFDRFAGETGMDYSQLTTFEGIREAAEKYYEWSGGKAFFYPLELFNYAMIGFKQLGEEFIIDGALNLSSPSFKKMWDVYYPQAVKGGVSVFDNYGNYLMATGEIVCVLDTSAGVTFYPEMVTYADNTKEQCEISILPHPVFAGGEKIVLQRGGGMCVFKSSDKKEYAACVFLKWLTQPEQNLRFTAQTGYMPVTKSAFGDYMAKEYENVTNENVKKLRKTIVEMKATYKFYYPPVFNGFEEIQRNYNQDLRKTAENSKIEYIRLLETLGPDAAYDAVAHGVFERFKAGR